jgi:hypothetical protein
MESGTAQTFSRAGFIFEGTLPSAPLRESIKRLDEGDSSSSWTYGYFTVLSRSDLNNE